MPGLEVENLAVAALERHAAAEDVPPFEPADEDEFPVFGNVETLSIHLLVLQLEILPDSLCDRVERGDVPEPLLLARLAPLERGAAAGYGAEIF